MRSFFQEALSPKRSEKNSEKKQKSIGAGSNEEDNQAKKGGLFEANKY